MTIITEFRNELDEVGGEKQRVFTPLRRFGHLPRSCTTESIKDLLQLNTMQVVHNVWIWFY